MPVITRLHLVSAKRLSRIFIGTDLAMVSANLDSWKAYYPPLSWPSGIGRGSSREAAYSQSPCYSIRLTDSNALQIGLIRKALMGAQVYPTLGFLPQAHDVCTPSYVRRHYFHLAILALMLLADAADADYLPQATSLGLL